MDISKLLPLLGGDEKTAALIQGLSGGDTSSLLSAAMQNSNPNTAKILGLMSAFDNKPQQKKPPAPGLKAVAPFASSDILGRLYKLLRL